MLYMNNYEDRIYEAPQKDLVNIPWEWEMKSFQPAKSRLPWANNVWIGCWDAKHLIVKDEGKVRIISREWKTWGEHDSENYIIWPYMTGWSVCECFAYPLFFSFIGLF